MRKKRTFVKVEKTAESSSRRSRSNRRSRSSMKSNSPSAAREEERQSALLAKQAEAKAKAPPKRRTKKRARKLPKQAPAADCRRRQEGTRKAQNQSWRGCRRQQHAPSQPPPTARWTENRPRIGERVVLKKDPPASEGTLHQPGTEAGRKRSQSREKDRQESCQAGRLWADDLAKRRGIKTRGDTSGGRDGWRSRAARNGMRMMKQPISRRRPNQSFAKCWCPKPLRSASLRRKWQ